MNEKLYNTLKERGVKLPSLDDFNNKIESDENFNVMLKSI